MNLFSGLKINSDDRDNADRNISSFYESNAVDVSAMTGNDAPALDYLDDQQSYVDVNSIDNGTCYDNEQYAEQLSYATYEGYSYEVQ